MFATRRIKSTNVVANDDGSVSVREEMVQPALSLIEGMLISWSCVGSPNFTQKGASFMEMIQKKIVPMYDEESVEEEEVLAEPVFEVPLVAASTPDPDLPVKEGSDLRKELNSVLIGSRTDSVSCSMGKCDFPKGAGVIRTPVSNLVFPDPVVRVDSPQLKMLTTGVVDSDLDFSILTHAYGDVFTKSVKAYKPTNKVVGWNTLRDTRDVLKNLVTDVEVNYPQFRTGDATDAYYHPLDPGKYTRHDHEMNSRDYALERILSGISEDAKIGVITTNDDHYRRLCEIFGRRIYIPVMEESVDIVLYEPYGKCWTWVDGSSIYDAYIKRIRKRAPLWEFVEKYVFPADKVSLDEVSGDDRGYFLYSIAHHRPRFYATSVKGDPPDAVMPKKSVPNQTRRNILRKNADALAFMMAVSARRNYLLSSHDAQVQRVWALKGGAIPIEDIYSLRMEGYLERPTRITFRKVRGVRGKFGAGLDVLKLIQDNYGDSMVTYEALKNLEIPMEDLQRLVLTGAVAVSVSRGTNYYGVVQPQCDVLWNVPLVPPSVVFTDKVVASYDAPLPTILPVPVSLKELLQIYHKKFPVTRDTRLYSEGDDEVVSKNS
jgi:hypothetical protein